MFPTRSRSTIDVGPKAFVETPVLDPGRGRRKTGYFCAIAGDDRPWGGGSDRR
jgi:hypothetical protein